MGLQSTDNKPGATKYALRNFQHSSNEISNRWIADDRIFGQGEGLVEAGHCLPKSTRSDWAFVTAGSAVLRPGGISPKRAREIDDFDRIECRCFLELVMDRRESGARDRGRALFYADVDIRALAGRAGRT